jgi:hypothetical protein
LVFSTRSRIAVPVVGVLLSIGGFAGSAVAAPPSTAACPSEAAGTFTEHFNSKHLEKTALGAGDIVADPSSWVGVHGALFTKMISQATTGSCGGSSDGGGYQP